MKLTCRSLYMPALENMRTKHRGNSQSPGVLSVATTTVRGHPKVSILLDSIFFFEFCPGINGIENLNIHTIH